MNRILLVEDEPIICASLKRLLERNQYDVTATHSVNEALEKLSSSSFDLIISDVRLPGQPGTSLIEVGNNTPVLLMTSYASLRSAVEAIKKGAVDYIAKPFDNQEMLEATAAAIKKHTSAITLQNKSTSTNKEQEASSQTTGIVGQSTQMNLLFNRMHRVAPTDSTVLILGESGTGKELVAKALHELSNRATGAMISVNCAAIPETLIESELFGHEKGAFTGAVSLRKGLVDAAHGGTLFLDEIGELPLEAQSRLLRLLQEKEVRRVGSTLSRKVDIRLIAATHRNLKVLAREGKFREDLYYRLNVIELNIPPLRNRGDDRVILAEFFIQKVCGKLKRAPLNFTSSALEAICAYSWPGNVRELENAIERAVVLCDEPAISADLLNLDANSVNSPMTNTIKVLSSRAKNIEDPQEDLPLEDFFMRFVLEHQEYMTETDIAQKLGISRKCLWERRQKLGIPRKKQTAKFF